MPLTEDTPYHPEWLQLEQTLGTRPCFSGDIATICTQFASVGAIIGPQFPARDESTVSAHDINLPVPSTPSEHIRLRVYTPVKAEKGTLPLGVYFHGGGFVMGDLETEDADCRVFAERVPCVVVSMEYRLAPENGWEVVLGDAVRGLEWALENATSIGCSHSKVFTIGISAGGCLALAAPKYLLSRAAPSSCTPAIRGIVTLCPLTAHASSLPEKFNRMYTSYSTNGTNVPIVSADALATFIKATGVKHDDASMFVSLGLEEMVRKGVWPKTFVVTADKDPLRDDGVVLEEILKDAGGDWLVKRQNYKGLPHCFWIFPGLQVRESLLKDVVDGILWVLH